MKRKYILSGLLACALTFSACDVDLLDIPQKGVENEENRHKGGHGPKSIQKPVGSEVLQSCGKGGTHEPADQHPFHVAQEVHPRLRKQKRETK